MIIACIVELKLVDVISQDDMGSYITSQKFKWTYFHFNFIIDDSTMYSAFVF